MKNISDSSVTLFFLGNICFTLVWYGSFQFLMGQYVKGEVDVKMYSELLSFGGIVIMGQGIMIGLGFTVWIVFSWLMEVVAGWNLRRM